MITPWNTNSGPSTHAELVGREWVKQGHKLTVFAHDGSNRSEGIILQKDEPYVVRCWGSSFWGHENWLDTELLLKTSFDIFVAQNLEILPMTELLKIYPEVRKKSKTVLVIHESRLPSNPLFYEFDWDAVVYFDERYKNFLVKAFPLKKIHMIPFPCHPFLEGDKKTSRIKLDLPLDRKIILVFGYSVWRNVPILPILNELSKNYPIFLLVLTIDSLSFKLFNEAKTKYDFPIEVRWEAPPLDKLYSYLHAADVLVKHVEDREEDRNLAILSSTVHLCLGSGCPIVVSDVQLFKNFNQEVLKYSPNDLTELKSKLIDVFEETENLARVKQKAKEYVEKNSSDKIAEKFIQLFQELLIGDKIEIMWIDSKGQLGKQIHTRSRKELLLKHG